MNSATMLAFFLPGNTEWLVLLVLGLLIFGRRLPEVGRSLGRGIVEFKRGIKGIESDLDDESSRPAVLPDKDAVSRRAEPAPQKLDKVEAEPAAETAGAEDDQPPG